MNARRSAWLLIGLGLFMALGATLVSCAPDTTAPALQIQLTAAPDNDTAAQPTAVAMDTENREDQACLDCHTNQELLAELAVEEVVENLNSGPG
ncbi:MAG: hypothetical protein H6673_05480 [Anaerolineales bacterium]|nr:hypothetical protein [Anaerolineales bacterium]